MAPANFSSLPGEIKAAILDRVGWQEEAWRARVDDMESEDEQKASEVAIHVNGVRAASRVSKEWRMLIGKHLFRVRANFPIFRHVIQHTYGHLFSQACLTSPATTTDPRDLDNTLSLIPYLTNIRSPELHFSAAQLLFGPELDFNGNRGGVKGMRIASLSRIARQVSDLTLENFRPGDVAKVLDLWPNVSRLHISAPPPDATVFDGTSSLASVSKMAVALAGKQRLATFRWEKLDSQACSPDIWKMDVIDKLRHNLPPLTTLMMKTPTLRQIDLDFITLFAPTLRRLEVNL
ncbi:hypothetical protein P7C70_g2481, partial [Phenoliferia sp. Uapishka_3]